MVDVHLIERLNRMADACAANPGHRSVLSTGERLAVALILDRSDWLAEWQYTMLQAIERVGADWMTAVRQAANIRDRVR